MCVIDRLDVSGNQLIGSLGREFFALAGILWQCSENLLEGTLPQRMRIPSEDNFYLMSVSSKADDSVARLRGALPQSLCLIHDHGSVNGGVLAAVRLRWTIKHKLTVSH